MSASSATASQNATTTAFSVLAAISFCHMLNDMMQSLLPALYPILKANYALTFAQIGILTFTFQVTASLLQPAIGAFTDKRPQPYSLAMGMGFTFVGLLLLSRAVSYPMLLVAAGLVGMGSAVLHPESSRVARMAAGGRPGLAQSLFQMGGNVGSSLGPLAAVVVLRFGQHSVAWFALAAVVAMVLLSGVGRWYVSHGMARMRAQAARERSGTLSRGRVVGALAILVALMLSKFVYTASMSSYYTFYLIDRFGVEVPQLFLFLYLASVAIGTVVGGLLGDRFGRKFVIWFSILGVLPFTLALPYANLFWTAVLTVPIGMILASAFPAIVVYGQELVPFRVGTVAGLFFGLAFGLGGVGAALLGQVADVHGIQYVFQLCSFLPVLGLLAVFLPHMATTRRAPAKA
ncbi:MAG TPA: MFS transporter [Gammaproteobacteria bacterium]|nr:MFS transporter [Gammaproteobacteria bacterium]